MNNDLDSISPAQAKSESVKPIASGLEKVRTLGAVVAILGASLGVSVGDALALRPPVVDTGDQTAADQLKLKSSQYKLDAKQQKLGSAQLKLDATQLKIDANQHKFDANQLKIGAPIGK